MSPRHIPLGLLPAAVLFLGGCVQRYWTPPPPAGDGYEYRYQGIEQRTRTEGADSYRIGNLRVTHYYSYGNKRTSEIQDPFLRAAREMYAPGGEVHGRFNEHLGDAGDKLEADR